MTDTHHRDSLINTLLASNAFRMAWPISAILPLVTSLGHKITHNEFMSLIFAHPNLDDGTFHASTQLTRKMFEKDDTRPTVTAFEHYTSVRS
jgi:hypothetical protein